MMTAGKVKSIEKTQKAPESSSPSRALARQPNVGLSAAGFAATSVPQMAGNLAVQQLFRAGAIQAKLSVSQPSDPYEQEADRVAQQVVNMPALSSVVSGLSSGQRQTPEKDEVVQTKPLVTTITPLVQRSSSNPSRSVQPGATFEAGLGSGGGPLPADTRAFMGPRFGADFSGIRLHADGNAAQLNRAIGAQAFTHGSHIYLGEGRSDIGSAAGKQLLAHELTHAIQQGAAGGSTDRAASQAVASLPVVQRQPAPAPPPAAAPPPVPAPSPAPAPGVTPPAPATPDQAAPAAWSLRGFLEGSQKVRVKAGSHNIYHEHAGKSFAWSTDQAAKAAGEKISVPLGTIPVPPPVGPIFIQVEGSAAVYAGGNALIDVSLNDVVLELTAGDIAKIGGLAVLATIGGRLLPALALLQGIKLYGKASLDAKALAKVTAGAKLELALAASSVWPVKGFVSAGLGIAGEIGALAFFKMKEAPIVLDFIGPIPRFRVLDLNISTGAELSAKLGLSGHLAIGVELGYGLIRRELLRASYNPTFNLKLGHAIGGGTPATLSTSGDGTPEIDLPKIYFMLKDLVSALIAGTERTPPESTGTESTGKVPVGSDDDPVLIYWCKPDRIYKNPILLDDEDAHENTPYYRDTAKLLDRAKGITIGVGYWPRVGDKITKQKGIKRIEQRRFIEVLELHNFEFGKSDFWKFSPDHVLDIGLAGDAADRIDNLWPAERTANEAAGRHHGNQSVWLRAGDQDPEYPTALSNVPDGTVLKIRAIVSTPPLQPPKP